MNLWKKPSSVLDSLKNGLSQELLNETLLTDHVKTEDYLMVVLGVRLCSLITIPAEFPNGNELGTEIDSLCAEDLRRVVEAPAEKKALLIPKLKGRIQECYRKVVLSSDAYKAHMSWSRRLSLRTVDIGVRPSIHELYVFKNPAVMKQLRRLAVLRAVARKEFASSKGFVGSRTSLAYAEELSSDYLNSAGKLLGYPLCCIKAYVNDRLDGEVNVEARASMQLRQIDEEIRQLSVHAYFVRNFFPCHPTCRNAIEIGRSSFRLLTDVDSRLGALYFECLRKNAKNVEESPKLSQLYRQKMEKKIKNN